MGALKLHHLRVLILKNFGWATAPQAPRLSGLHRPLLQIASCAPDTGHYTGTGHFLETLPVGSKHGTYLTFLDLDLNFQASILYLASIVLASIMTEILMVWQP